MTSKLTKLFIEFASDIVSDNTALDQDEVKSILSKKDSRQQIDDFFKNNKIKQKKEKKDSDSDEPKKPKTAYIIFCSSERDTVVDANPGVEHKDITSLLGKRWKDIQLNDKDLFQKYNDLAVKEKSEYEEKMKEYRIQNNIPEKIEKVKKPKVVKPEKAMSSFYYYLQDVEDNVTESNPTLSKKEILDIIKKDWKDLKDEKDNDIVKKYKQMAVDKKLELKTSVSVSTQTSPPSSPIHSSHVLSPIHSSPASPVLSIKNNVSSPKKKKKETADGEPKKKKKKETADGEPKKKKKLIKKVEEDEEEMNFE